jgi:hypothetical protein
MSTLDFKASVVLPTAKHLSSDQPLSSNHQMRFLSFKQPTDGNVCLLDPYLQMARLISSNQVVNICPLTSNHQMRLLSLKNQLANDQCIPATSNHQICFLCFKQANERLSSELMTSNHQMRLLSFKQPRRRCE